MDSLETLYVFGLLRFRTAKVMSTFAENALAVLAEKKKRGANTWSVVRSDGVRTHELPLRSVAFSLREPVSTSLENTQNIKRKGRPKATLSRSRWLDGPFGTKARLVAAVTEAAP